MFNTDPVGALQKRWKLIFLVGMIFAIAGGLLTLLFPLQYRAEAQVLIISRSAYGVDPYTTVKSAERIGENLREVMKTNDFYQNVRRLSEFPIDWNYFEQKDEREKRKLWVKTVESSVVYGTGVVTINTYHRDAEQAKALAGAASKALMNTGRDYVGSDVAIKVINEPVATRYPVRPNIALNIVLGFVVGVLFMGFLSVRRG